MAEITETITFKFDNEAQQQRFHQRLRGDDSSLIAALEGERTRIANAVIRRYATSKSSGSWSMLAEDTARFITMLPPPAIAREALRPALEKTDG